MQRPQTGSNYAATPSQNVPTRPLSVSILHNQMSTTNSRLNTISSNSSGHLNVGFPTTGYMNIINVMERPITQHGVAAIRPGTGRGISITRQIQDKRYYIGLMQLKIRELNQEIAIIMKDIEDQNKERATYIHYDKRAKDLATELTVLQGHLADYNIVVDKMTSDIGKEIIDQETEELATKNEHNLSKIENMYEERKQLENKLNKIEGQLENEKKKTGKLVESMNDSTREKYEELLKEKASLQEKATKMQQELDELYKEQLYLEEEIALSPLKQEAVKLHLKIIEVEEKRNKLQEKEKHRISPEEEREKLLQKIKQENIDIAAAEAQLTEKKKQIQEAEQKLEQLETDIEDTQSEKQMKYKELRKREEIIEQFMITFEQNKQDETIKLHKLEETIVEYLENISNIINVNINFRGSDEIAILNNLPPFNEYEYINNGQNFEKLSKDNLRLQQILSEMEMLEKKLKIESDNLNEKMKQEESKLIILEDLDSLKTKLAIKQGQLTKECEQLKQQQATHEQELKAIQFEYNEIKQRLENNDEYSQINILQNTVENLLEEHKKIENFIQKQRQRSNYGPMKTNVFNSMNSYNTMLKQNLKIIY